MSVLLVTQYIADMNTADVERVQAFCGSVLRARYATRGELDEIEPRVTPTPRDTMPATNPEDDGG